MDSLSVRKTLDLFSRKDMHLLKSFTELKRCLWTILYRKSDQKISFINSSVLNRTGFCFFHWAILDLSFQHVISQVFSSLANKNVFFRAMHHLIENALFLP